MAPPTPPPIAMTKSTTTTIQTQSRIRPRWRTIFILPTGSMIQTFQHPPPPLRYRFHRLWTCNHPPQPHHSQPLAIRHTTPPTIPCSRPPPSRLCTLFRRPYRPRLPLKITTLFDNASTHLTLPTCLCPSRLGLPISGTLQMPCVLPPSCGPPSATVRCQTELYANEFPCDGGPTVLDQPSSRQVHHHLQNLERLAWLELIVVVPSPSLALATTLMRPFGERSARLL